MFSDGEDWRGDAIDAAAALRRAGTTVYAVGLGTAAGAPIPMTDHAGAVIGEKMDREGRTVVTRLDMRGLAAIAKAGGGALWSGDGAVGGVAAKLASVPASELEERRIVVHRERFQIVLACGLALLALAAAFFEAKSRWIVSGL